MLKLVLQRFGLGVLTLFGASVLIFIGTEMMPGDLASSILQNSATPESLAKLRLDLGLDRPAILRFFDWLFGALHGDFGHSLANGRDVLTEIAPRFANTMFLAAYAAIVAVPLAVGLGRAGGDPARRMVRPTDQSHHVDDDFRARILPRLCPHQICRGGSRLVSLARQRVRRTWVSAIVSTMRSCRC